jgi:hypothetical protein
MEPFNIFKEFANDSFFFGRRSQEFMDVDNR